MRPPLGVSRRFLLSSLAALPVLTGPLSRISAQAQPAADPLASWNEGPAKQAILDFVAAVTRERSPEFVPASERIATFDNDGTLWCEQPMYVQLAFIIDRIKALAAQHPEWSTTQPYSAVLAGDIKALGALGEKGLTELVAATHGGMTTDRFANIVSDWLSVARHPRFLRPYTELVYQPMLEVLAFLRANGFKTFIVSGGGVEFLRPWTDRIYDVPPEQVVGSRIKTRFVITDGRPQLFREGAIDFVDDKAGKPVGINEHIGRRPIAAFGNSDGDLQMLQWATLPSGRARLGVIVHHTDGEREYAYDRHAAFGRLDVALDAAETNAWPVVDMKKDWKQVFPAASRQGSGERAIK